MTTDSDIRKIVGRFLTRDIALKTLRSRVTPIRWDVENPPDPDALRMLGILGRYFAEYSNGDWTEEELRTELIPFGPLVVMRLRERIMTRYATTSSGQGVVVSVTSGTGQTVTA